MHVLYVHNSAEAFYIIYISIMTEYDQHHICLGISYYFQPEFKLSLSLSFIIYFFLDLISTLFF